MLFSAPLSSVSIEMSHAIRYCYKKETFASCLSIGFTSPVDSNAYACNLIMEINLHQCAQAFKKELDAGLARRSLFLNFPGLIVMQLCMEWAKKTARVLSRNQPCVRCCRFLKTDEKQTGKDFPLDNPWAEFLYRYAPSVSDLDCDAIEPTVQIVKLEELSGFSFKN